LSRTLNVGEIRPQHHDLTGGRETQKSFLIEHDLGPAVLRTQDLANIEVARLPVVRLHIFRIDDHDAAFVVMNQSGANRDHRLSVRRSGSKKEQGDGGIVPPPSHSIPKLLHERPVA